MKHHRKTVGKHTQKKNGMRKTMKGGFWPFTSSTPVTTSSDITYVAPVDTTQSTKSYSKIIYDFFDFTKKTDTPVTPPLPNENNNNNTGGYMGGKRKGKTAKKPCPKKGGGK